MIFNLEEDNLDKRREAAIVWWNTLTQEKRKEVFIELLVSNQTAALHIKRWVKDQDREQEEKSPKRVGKVKRGRPRKNSIV